VASDGLNDWVFIGESLCAALVEHQLYGNLLVVDENPSIHLVRSHQVHLGSSVKGLQTS
jgi:hypothetical protein